MTSNHAASAANKRLTAEQAVASGRDFVELAASPSGVFWTAYAPADATCRIWRWHADTHAEPACVTPDGFSVRGRVYEYGGGSFCIAGHTLVFANEADQRLYRQSIDGGVPHALTPPGPRYGDLRFAPGRVLAVEQDGDTHRLVAINLDDGARDVLAEGADFYAAPTLNADGTRLAWIEWQHPHQPWTATRLMLQERAADGTWSTPRIVAGHDDDEALQQPCFDASGHLVCLSDRANFWQPWRDGASGFEPLPAAAADHASAPWQLGGRSWLPLEDGASVASWFDDSWGVLGHRDAGGNVQRLASGYSRFRNLAADGAHLYCIAASPECPAAVLAIRRSDYRVSVLGEVAPSVPATQIRRPEIIRYRSGDTDVHGYFYAPADAPAFATETAAPPVVVFVHGGPTSACYPVFDPRVEFWTQRGFAIAQLNYRGSTGYGRAYRQALHRNWGVIDVDDACNAVAYLAQHGQVDPRRAFIRGNSSGGYTTLCALAFRDTFRGGASLYGVSDPLTLDAATHKFEARYLHWLIGDPVAERERYRSRTPLLHADTITAPVIFFQGELDAVVTPDQTRSMVAALDANGIETEAHYYADERHGFRQAANQAHALDAEHAFYRRILDAR
ncbi:prolyl oligopeptidase family serine peptidase [Paraburkholderia sp.]|uniref:S9 family peptidase n=1 Tax=Paraburkholderia sp. TaxID=1926495 RepID=UPI0023988265|nr:prolyl oligopeptidase family serine peptidase [Paraburkholderia sp.]MDE1179980.1 prolyl oligopeptidase family serine peptidase [Paraburkholderia sp.]